MNTRCIRTPFDEELPALERLVREHWGSSIVVSRGRMHRLDDLEWLVEQDGDRWLGMAGFRFEDSGCELVLLEAFEQWRGTGSALLEAVAQAARVAGTERLWVITTNDNTDALRFYQRRGFALAALHRDAVAVSRKLKPEIPPVGEHGIPIRDELELERWLVPTQPDAATADRA